MGASDGLVGMALIGGLLYVGYKVVENYDNEEPPSQLQPFNRTIAPPPPLEPAPVPEPAPEPAPVPEPEQKAITNKTAVFVKGDFKKQILDKIYNVGMHSWEILTMPSADKPWFSGRTLVSGSLKDEYHEGNRNGLIGKHWMKPWQESSSGVGMEKILSTLKYYTEVTGGLFVEDSIPLYFVLNTGRGNEYSNPLLIHLKVTAVNKYGQFWEIRPVSDSSYRSADGLGYLMDQAMW